MIVYNIYITEIKTVQHQYQYHEQFGSKLGFFLFS